MKLEIYDKKQINNSSLINKIKQINDNAFGTGPSIVNMSINEIKHLLKNGFILGLVVNNELVAHLQIEYKSNYWYIFGISVDPKFHKKGFGNILVKALIKMAGNKKLSATVREDNIASLSLFINKNEFLITNFLKNHFGLGKDRLLMEYGPHIKQINLLNHIVRINCNNKKKIESTIKGGYVGFNIDKGLIHSYILFKKKR